MWKNISHFERNTKRNIIISLYNSQFDLKNIICCIDEKIMKVSRIIGIFEITKIIYKLNPYKLIKHKINEFIEENLNFLNKKYKSLNEEMMEK